MPQKRTNGVKSTDVSHLCPILFAEEEEQYWLVLIFLGFVFKEVAT